MPIPTDPSHDTLVALTAGIVAAYVRNHVLPSADVGRVIADVHQALATIGTGSAQATPAVERLKPPVSIRKSIHDDYLICLEDGQKFKSLKRHLTSKYGLTPDEYREKWGLPDDYPMVAPAYAIRRSQLAKDSGLGRKLDNA